MAVMKLRGVEYLALLDGGPEGIVIRIDNIAAIKSVNASTAKIILNSGDTMMVNEPLGQICRWLEETPEKQAR